MRTDPRFLQSDVCFGQVAGPRGKKNAAPDIGTLLRPCGGQVAQLVEQRTENPRVGSSILPLATIFSKTYVLSGYPFFPIFRRSSNTFCKGETLSGFLK